MSDYPRLIKYGSGFIITLEVDEKFLDVESHSLMLVNWQKGTSPSYLLRNPTYNLRLTLINFTSH